MSFIKRTNEEIYRGRQRERARQSLKERKDNDDEKAECFIEDRCTLGSKNRITLADLYAAFTEWCEGEREEVPPIRRFAKALRRVNNVGSCKIGAHKYLKMGLKGKVNRAPIQSSKVHKWRIATPKESDRLKTDNEKTIEGATVWRSCCGLLHEILVEGDARPNTLNDETTCGKCQNIIRLDLGAYEQCSEEMKKEHRHLIDETGMSIDNKPAPLLEKPFGADVDVSSLVSDAVWE
jgi:hypothetical protein